VATPILKQAASKGLDIGAPVLGASVSTFLGGNPVIGAFVGNREILKQQTGFGQKNQSQVATLIGGSVGEVLQPITARYCQFYVNNFASLPADLKTQSFFLNKI